MGNNLPRVSQISITRLHNLGNYEHVKYEITLDVPAGAAPGEILRKVELTLSDLAKKCPIGVHDYQRAVELLAKPHEQRTDLDEANMASAQDTVRRYLDFHRKLKTAYGRFDALGGGSERTDHKQFWEDEWDYDDPANFR